MYRYGQGLQEVPALQTFPEGPSLLLTFNCDEYINVHSFSSLLNLAGSLFLFFGGGGGPRVCNLGCELARQVLYHLSHSSSLYLLCVAGD
jgi:hypothetical protein